ncbi:MAG: hypothetical protein M0T78_11165 [Actinomycetota bacterium]|nr:hypothetical protein [Actinomycetota bacterium]
MQRGMVFGAAIWMAPSIDLRELSVELSVGQSAKDLYDRSVDSVVLYLEDLPMRSAGDSKAIIEAQVQIARDPALRKKVFLLLTKVFHFQKQSRLQVVNSGYSSAVLVAFTLSE